MELNNAILLLQLINMGLDTGMQVGFAFDKIKGMSEDEVNAAIASEEARTQILIDAAHKI